MTEIIDAVSELLDEHWAKLLTAALASVAGWFWARYRAHRAWSRREFYHRLNLSLNLICDGKLLIRTLFELPCNDVFLNQVATKRLLKYAESTTRTEPVIPIPQEDSWYYLNAVLNEVSEQFASGMLHKDAGLPVTEVAYVLTLTNECDGEIRTRKIRAMMIREDLLEALPAEPPQLEAPHHRIRWETLQRMQEIRRREPWRFITVQLALPSADSRTQELLAAPSDHGETSDTPAETVSGTAESEEG